LEALLSARERLYISYVGQSNQDNSRIRPSVLVSELIDVLEQGFQIEGKPILDQILTRHRLQPFSSEYFKGDEKLFSYSRENCEAAGQFLGREEKETAFISAGLSEPDEHLKAVDLDDFCRFFMNPSKFLLNKRLGIWLEEKTSILEGREAFELEGLEKYLLEKDLLDRGFQGADLDVLLPVIRAGGVLPHGAVGECLYERLSRGVDRFMKRTLACMRGSLLEPLEVNLPLCGVKLTGLIKGLYPDRLIRYRYAKVKPEDRLKTWIHHLVLNVCVPERYPGESLLVGLERSDKNETHWAAWVYKPVTTAREILENLSVRYQEGLVRPLPFFPGSSWGYAQEILEKKKSHEEGIVKAREKWDGSRYSRGDREDAYFETCFREGDALGPPFAELAEEVFGPLMEHQEKIE
jgi:exodeoxyribonuclease V gamma subunit